MKTLQVLAFLLLLGACSASDSSVSQDTWSRQPPAEDTSTGQDTGVPTGELGGPCFANGTCFEGLTCDTASNSCVGCLDGTEACNCYGNDTCNEGLKCEEGQCVPDEETEPRECEGEPDCSGLECGPDPVCGESCGVCGDDMSCFGGKCKGEDDLIIEEGYSDLPSECTNGSPDYAYKDGGTVHEIPLKVWVQDKDGVPAVNKSQMQDDLEETNKYYEKAGIEFYVHETASFGDEGDLDYDSHFVSLVYWHYLSNVCGKAMKGPVSKPYAWVDVGCAHPNGTTTAHELGHAMGLHHPHGTPGPAAVPIEPLDSNCYNTEENEGDYLCDTPPDPSKKFCPENGNCTVTCMEPYQDYEPQVGNLMSYYADKCQNYGSAFTPEQRNTMRCVFEEFYKEDMSCPADNCGGTCPEVCAQYDCGVHSGCNCGNCQPDYFCNENGKCIQEGCETLCTEVGCGAYKGCDCGTCGQFEKCINNECVEKPCGEICSDDNKNCGNYFGCACGECKPGTEECVDNVCIQLGCQEICADAECGNYKGCDCGGCPWGEKCDGNQCVVDCTQLCSGKDCGFSETCNCGDCGLNEKCVANECVPDCLQLCSGKECGSVGDCDCGDCGWGKKCQSNSCVPDCPVVCQGKDCGTTDGCDCGDCSNGYKCVANSCQKDCDQLCSGKCGSYQGCSCGGCSTNYECVNNTCQKDCDQLCSGKCGSYQGCSCGGCSNNYECVNNTCQKDCDQLCSGKCGSYQGCNCGSCSGNNSCVNNQCVLDCTKVCSGVDCGNYQGCNCGNCSSGYGCYDNDCYKKNVKQVYWWAPLDISAGGSATMAVQTTGYVGATVKFKVWEVDDLNADDWVGTICTKTINGSEWDNSVSAQVTTCKWTGICSNPAPEYCTGDWGDPEFRFEVEIEGASYESGNAYLTVDMP